MASHRPALPAPRRPVPRSNFGRVSVGVYGRVMMSIAEGPFDAALMAATQPPLAQA